MKLKELINESLLHTPTERELGVDYYHHILNGLNAYQQKLEKLENFKIVDSDKSYEGIHYNEKVYSTVLKLNRSIIKTLRLYYDGQPASAYNTLRESIEDDVFSSSKSGLSFTRIRSPLFRIRKEEERSEKLFSPKELFHIPMTLREKVSSQRFSIPGYPCLYLADSIFLCSKELGGVDLEGYQVSKFESIEDVNGFESIVLMDLTNNHPKLIRDSKTDLWDGEVYRFLILWPLIFASSVKVSYRDRYFKPEYIIPQLLMQYVRGEDSERRKPHGIKYSSTHVDLYKRKTEVHNYAIPIRSSTKEPFCNFLVNKFKLTYPEKLMNLRSGGGIAEKDFLEIEDELMNKPLIQLTTSGEIKKA